MFFFITEVRFSFEPPSQIACACLALAMHGLSDENDLKETLKVMQQVTDIDSVRIVIIKILFLLLFKLSCFNIFNLF